MPVNLFTPGLESGASAWLYVDELTHRTLNDYTAMLSMIRRASVRMTEVAGLTVLDEVATRLRASASVHALLRPLYGSRSGSLENDLEQLCASLASSVLADRSICLTLSSEPITLDTLRCWKISLIVCELVMNAAKHAFSGRGGSITVDVRTTDRMIQCCVGDDGEGSSAAMPGRGSCIVDAVAHELGGRVLRRFSSLGSMTVLCVPIAEPHRPRADTIV